MHQTGLVQWNRSKLSEFPGLGTEYDLPLNKMAPFSSSLLALCPTPEPVMRPTSPAKEAGSPVQEVPETEQQKLLHSWVTLLQALDTQVKIIPGDGPELFEDKETWTRGWSQLSVQLVESATTAECLKMELEFDDMGRTILEEGKHAYKIFSKEIHEIKERAVVDPPPRTPPCPKCLLQKMVAEVILPGSKDSGGKLVELPALSEYGAEVRWRAWTSLPYLRLCQEALFVCAQEET
ncbi:hypothetical protein F4604DRAFT_1675875 [Suillus subluteus]|nr:hypothetical protein F4604DRAFT_1675875 [Suillus subluteus]